MTKFTPIKDRVEYGGAMIGKEEVDAIMRVVTSQGGKRWTIGPESVAFERELAVTTGVKRAVVVNSGSSALLVALGALKLGKGAYVGIPALNFPTAFNAILQNGYVPVVFDIKTETMNISLDQVEEYVSKGKLDAILPVNIASNPVDLPRLRSIIGEKTKIVLDNCDGYGTMAYLDGMFHFVDTLADVSCVSFHAAHIITTGEGGAILTDDEKVADTATKMREWGRASGTDKLYNYPNFPSDYRERYVYEEIGYNLKPLELQCAMGRVQLKKLDTFRELRIRNYKWMMDEFEKLDKFETVEEDMEHVTICYFSFPFYCRRVQREAVMEELEKNNIECRTIFSGNILLHPAYKDTECITPFTYPNATDVMRNGMFISVHPSVTKDMITFIGDVLWKM